MQLLIVCVYVDCVWAFFLFSLVDCIWKLSRRMVEKALGVKITVRKNKEVGKKNMNTILYPVWHITYLLCVYDTNVLHPWMNSDKPNDQRQIEPNDWCTVHVKKVPCRMTLKIYSTSIHRFGNSKLCTAPSQVFKQSSSQFWWNIIPNTSIIQSSRAIHA